MHLARYNHKVSFQYTRTFQNFLGVRLPSGYLRVDFSIKKFSREVINFGLLTVVKCLFLSDKRINQG
jgi:hypothetical protein